MWKSSPRYLLLPCFPSFKLCWVFLIDTVCKSRCASKWFQVVLTNNPWINVNAIRSIDNNNDVKIDTAQVIYKTRWYYTDFFFIKHESIHVFIIREVFCIMLQTWGAWPEVDDVMRDVVDVIEWHDILDLKWIACFLEESGECDVCE